MSDQNPAEQINEETIVELSFDGHPAGEIYTTQTILGLSPQLVFTAEYEAEQDSVIYSISTYGTDAPAEFLEAVIEALQALIPRVALETERVQLEAEREEDGDSKDED